VTGEVTSNVLDAVTSLPWSQRGMVDSVLHCRTCPLTAPFAAIDLQVRIEKVDTFR